MQGASILAVSKVVESDGNRSGGASGVTMSKHDAFKSCLKRQSQQINGPNDQETKANARQLGDKSGKLDRSALLRSSGSTNHLSKNVPPDNQGAETQDISPQTATSIGCCQNVTEAASTADPTDKHGEDVLTTQVSHQAEAPTPTALAIESNESKIIQPIPMPSGQDPLADITLINPGNADTTITESVVASSGLNGEPQTSNKVDEETGNMPQSVSLPEDSDNIVMEVPEKKAAQSNTQAVATDTSDLKSATEQTVTAGSLFQTPTITGKSKTGGTQSDNTGTKEQPATAASSSVAANQTPTATDTSSGDQDRVDVVPEVTASENQAAAATSSAGLQSAESQADKTAAALTVTQSTSGNADTTAKADTGITGSAKTDEGKSSEAAKTDKTDTVSLKTAGEVVKALNGKLEESEAKNGNTAEKKDANNSGDLKKLMEFESNRLQAVQLNGHSNEQGTSTRSEGQQVVSLNQGMEHSLVSDSNQKLTADLTSKTAVDVKNLVDQLVQKAELVVKSNSSEMKIQLEPEFLGKMTIKVVLEDGLLTARFITNNHDVKHLLDNNLATLRQSLEAQGIKVEKTQVNVQLDSGGTFGGYQEGRQEMWQRPETSNYQSDNSLDISGYQLANDEELMESAFSQSDIYGIQADGSLNFVV